MRGTCLSLLLALVPSLASAEALYRWVDAQGNVHLGETAPPGAAAEVWKPKPLESAPAFPLPQGAAPRAKPRAAARTPSARAAPEQATVGGRTEAQWRREALEKEARISSIESRIAETEAMPDSWSSHSTGGGVRVVHRDSDKERILSRLRRDLERAQADAEQFEDYARSLGVPPGWLR